jgi:hypothetical protein
MSPAIIGIGYTRKEAGHLQPVDEANECARPDVENLRKSGLVEPYEPREMDEDGASRPRHAWELRVQLSVEEAAPQPGSFYQELHDCIGIFRIEIIRGRQCWSCDRDLLQQMADCRFVRVVALHKLSHNWLGQKLIKRRLVERRRSRRRARDRTIVWDRHVPPYTAPCAAGHNSAPLAGSAPRSCDGWA